MIHDSGYMIHDSRKKMLNTLLPNLISCILYLISAGIILLSFVDSAHALDVKRTVLESGLTLLVSERHNLPIVKVSIGIKAGSLYEPEEKAGLANLTAALLKAGTQKRNASQISEEQEFVGASLGAHGGSDYITVGLSILKKDLELGFDLLSDIMLNPVFPEDELNKKRDLVKGSLKAREEDPGFIASRAFKSALFGAHPYGRLISGTPDTLDNIKRDDLKEFHSAFYVPNNSIMSVVGDITAEEVDALLSEYFAKWKSKKVNIPSLPELKKTVQKKTISIDKDLTQANIILGHVGISRNNPDYYKVSVMNYILGSGGMASRLMQNIRVEKGLVYDIHSFFMADKLGGSFRVTLQTKNESANKAIEEILREIRRIMNIQVSDSELSDAKAFLTGSFPMRIETSSRIARFLVAVEFHGLGTEYINNYPGYISKVTREDIQDVAKKYLDPDKFVLVVVADHEKALLKKEFK